MSNDAKKIERAIRACIRDCFGSNAVLAKIAIFLDNLQRDPDWRSSEVLVVENSVRRMLKGTFAEKKLGSTPPVAQARKSA